MGKPFMSQFHIGLLPSVTRWYCRSSSQTGKTMRSLAPARSFRLHLYPRLPVYRRTSSLRRTFRFSRPHHPSQLLSSTLAGILAHTKHHRYTSNHEPSPPASRRICAPNRASQPRQPFCFLSGPAQYPLRASIPPHHPDPLPPPLNLQMKHEGPVSETALGAKTEKATQDRCSSSRTSLWTGSPLVVKVARPVRHGSTTS
ncbi:hypothetical protein OF83DRAFT_302949 [Amylostereum chailletii]|nr:hypothetical protein OF83DRAFT_302949 [Amylostereum chailletii]